MRTSLTKYFMNEFVNRIFGRDPYTVPTSLFFGLWASALNSESTGETWGEIQAPSYHRVEVANVAASFDASVGGRKVNSVEIAFPVAAEEWGVIRYVAVLDAATAGNMLLWSELSTPKFIFTGDMVRFPPSSFVIDLV